MPVNLSIKGVPDELAESLRERARRNHRSLQGELMAMIEGYVARRGGADPGAGVREAARPWGRSAVEQSGRGLNVGTERLVWGPGESALIIRQTREEQAFTIEDLFEYVRSLPFETPSESAAWIRKSRQRT